MSALSSRLVGLLALLPPLLAPRLVESAERPNFVVIMADDLGYGDLGCYGGTRYETPHLDAMAKAGLRLTDYHSNGPVCSPTRAALLTGRYQQRAGIPGVVKADPKANRHHGLHTHETTFAELLKKAGYATAVFGKWHVGYDKKFNPVHHGFDEFRGYVSGNVDYVSHVDQAGFVDWWRNDELVPEEGYSTHLITAHACRFVREQAQQPFCLYVAHEAPHYPLQGPDDPPERSPGKVTRPKLPMPERLERYATMVREMDKGIGEIRATLEELGLSKKTLVVFLSDNGATSLGSNGTLRGFKGSVWEGGHRVPGIACWPGTVEAGRESPATTIGMDVMPTMLELAGVEAPAERPLDGVSFASLLKGDEPEGEPRTLVWEFGNGAAVRRGDWKLVVGGKGQKSRKPALFDLANDLGESKDLADEHPERVRELWAALEEWRRDVTDGATVQPEK